MGMFRHFLVPKTVRKISSPIYTARHKLTPKLVKKVTYDIWKVRHPVRHAVYKATSSNPNPSVAETPKKPHHFHVIFVVGIAILFIIAAITSGSSTPKPTVQTIQKASTNTQPSEPAPEVAPTPATTPSSSEPSTTPAVTTTPAPTPAVTPTPATSDNSSTELIKLSRTGICHVPGDPYYNATTHFIPYASLQSCLDAGGRLPKN